MTFLLVFFVGAALFTLGIVVGHAMATMDAEDEMTPERREAIRKSIREWRGH